MRFADEAVSRAYRGEWRDAYIAAGRARHRDPSLPGMEILIGQMLANEGHLCAASGYARAAQIRGESRGQASLLFGLEAWSRRGPLPPSLAAAANTSLLWLEDAASHAPSDAAPRFFLAELARLTGGRSGHAMEKALYRFQPWESFFVIQAKMHLASSESGGLYNAMDLGEGLRLDDSPQARSVRNMHRNTVLSRQSDAAEREFRKVFTTLQVSQLMSDPALAGKSNGDVGSPSYSAQSRAEVFGDIDRQP